MLNRYILPGLALFISYGIAQAETAKSREPGSVSAPSSSEKKNDPNAQQGASGSSDGVSDEAKAAQASLNPLNPNYIQLPIQSYINFDQGPIGYKSPSLTTRAQALIPVSINEDLLVLLRPIAPVSFAPSTGPYPWQRSSSFGMSDLVYNAYFTTNSPMFQFGDQHFLTFSLGPGFTFPTETSNTLGNHRYTIGPQWAAVYGNHGFLAAFVFSQNWSVGKVDGWKNVNAFSLQPIISYTFPSSWYLVTDPIINLDWTAKDRKATVPIGGGLGKAFKMFDQTFSMNAGLYYNVVRQRNDARWQVQFQLTAVLPNIINSVLHGKTQH